MEKLYSEDDVVEEKLIFFTDSYFFDGTKTFRLTLKPSSALRSLDVVKRDLKIFRNNKTLLQRMVSLRNLQLKDVRANCFCASLLRTQFTSRCHATSCIERARC